MWPNILLADELPLSRIHHGKCPGEGLIYKIAPLSEKPITLVKEVCGSLTLYAAQHRTSAHSRPPPTGMRERMRRARVRKLVG